MYLMAMNFVEPREGTEFAGLDLTAESSLVCTAQHPVPRHLRFIAR